MAFILLSIKTGETRFKTCGKLMTEFQQIQEQKTKKKKEKRKQDMNREIWF